MSAQQTIKSAIEIQRAADVLLESTSEAREDALEQLAKTILDYYGHRYDSSATSELFSRELPNNIQRFSAVWLLHILSRSAMALQFRNTEGLTASLFDQVFQHDMYPRVNIEVGTQTFEKLNALVDYLQTAMEEAETLIGVTPSLDQVSGFQGEIFRIFKQKSALLMPLLSRPLINANRLRGVFRTVHDYTKYEDTDPIYRRDAVYEACTELEQEASIYGTTDADRIIGGLARQLRSAVKIHFDSLEASVV